MQHCKHGFPVVIGVAGASLVFFVATAALGQSKGGMSGGQGYKEVAETKAGAPGSILLVRKVEGIGPRARLRTPEYQSNVSAGRVPAREWARVMVTYDTIPDWIDELTVYFHVVVLKEEKGKEKYTLFKGAVTYVDVPKGRGHEAMMFLRPTALARYGEVLGVAVEIVYQGATVAVESEQAARLKDYKEWWKNPGPNVVLLDGYLLNRSQTPYAYINWDDYDTIK